MNRHSSRRGISIEYAIVLMAVVLAFAALLLTLALSSNARADDYGNYLARKQLLDEIGEAFLAGEKDLQTAYAEQIAEYSLVLDEGESALTVSRKKTDGTAGSVLLTIVTDEEQNCLRYVYGKI